MHHTIQCQCGTLKGYVEHPEKANRAVCYCKDCQYFAHFLQADTTTLDATGGTDIVQTLPRYVHFTAGIETLKCLRLTDAGLLRWYASCCSTPIANTPPNFKLSFVGLIHNCLECSKTSVEDAFGPISMHVNTEGAKGQPKPKPSSVFSIFRRLMPMLAMARINGSYKHTPFFSSLSGKPVVTPSVLSSAELSELKSAI